MSCKPINPANGKNSVLFDQLLDIFKNYDRAEFYYSKVTGASFKEKFGDWESVYKKESAEVLGEVDPKTGEPKLIRKPKTNQYYFKLKDGTKLFVDKKGLRGSFTPEQIKDVTGWLLYKYVQYGGTKDANVYGKKSDQVKLGDTINNAIADYRAQISGLNDAQRAYFEKRIARVEDFKDEFRAELAYAVESLGQRFKEEILDEKGNESSESEVQNEERKTDGLNIKESITVNPKNTATTSVKIFLSQLKSKVKDKDGNWIDKKSPFLKTPVYEDFSRVWETLQPILADTVTTGSSKQDIVSSYSRMMKKLKELTAIEPWAHDLVDKLETLYDKKRYKAYEFVQAMNKARQQYNSTVFNDKTKTYNIINATETNSRESQILAEWGSRFQFRFLPNGAVSLSNEAVTELTGIRNDINQTYNEWKNELKELKKQNLNEVEKANGINEIQVKYIPEFFNLFKKLGAENLVDSDINRMILLNGGVDNQESTTNDMIEGILYMLDPVLRKNHQFITDGKYNNPFATEKFVKMLSSSVAGRMTDYAESTVLGPDGDTYYVYSNPTYLSNKINEWKDNPHELKQLLAQESNRNSKWIQYLLATEFSGNENEQLKVSKERLTQLQATVSASMTTQGKNDGVTNKDISLQDQLNDHISKVLGEKTSAGKSIFASIVAADKSRRIEFSGFRMFNSQIKRNKAGSLVIHPKTIDRFVGYLTDEYNRITKVEQEIQGLPMSKLVENYHTGEANGLKFQLFPELNVVGEIPEFNALRKALFNKDGSVIDRKGLMELTDFQKEKAIDVVRKSLNDRILEAEVKIQDLNESTYMNQELLDAYEKDGSGLIGLTADYVVNGMISTIEYTKLFSGDPAYYKSLPDMMKRIPATYTDGLQLVLESGDDLRFNAAIVRDIKGASRYRKLIADSVTDKTIANAYKSVNITDAQAWITPRRWKFLKERLGQWSDLHDEVFSKMESGKRLDDNELVLAAQPLKGVYFERNQYGAPTYLKYSQAVLIPSMVRGTPMERLLEAMTKDKNGADEVHEVITVSGAKVGAMAPSKINDSHDLKEDITLNPMQLTNKGWKLQQDLPVKTMHETNIGTQIQKNILDGLALDKKYIVNGKSINGSELLKMVHDSIGDLINIGKEELDKKLGISNARITDKTKLYDILIAEFRKRGGDENIISALEKETPFDAIPQIKGRIDSILMSVFNNALTKISTNGGSFIQVSPFGLETVKEIVNIDNLVFKNSEEYKKLLEIRSDFKKDFVSGYKKHSDLIGMSDAIFDSLAPDKVWSNGIIDPKTGKGTPINTRQVFGKSEKEMTDMIRSKFKKWFDANVEREASVKTIILNGKEVNIENPTTPNEILGAIVKGFFDTTTPAIEKYVESKNGLEAAMIKALSEKTKKKVVYQDDDDDDTSKKVLRSNIQIISDNYDGVGLLPPRKGPNGQTLPGQVMIPHTLALKILREKNIHPSRADWKTLFKDPKVRELVGYRIPNQGMSSNDILEIVGILPETMGDSIIGYDGIPAKTGSDFDIDKMYIMAPNLMFNPKNKQFEVITDENVEFYKGKDAKKMVAQNKVLGLYADILKSSNTYDNMMTSIDEGSLKKDILSLFPEAPAKNLDLFSPITQLETKKEYMSGKQGVGLTANQLVDHVSNQSLQLSIIHDTGLIYDNRLWGYSKKRNATKIDRPVPAGQETINRVLSQFLNAYVDIAKDPYVSRGNHNIHTANITFMLVRAGVPIEKINRIIAQPILKEYVELLDRQTGITKKPLTIKKDGEVVFVTPYEYLRDKYKLTEDPELIQKSYKQINNISNEQLESRIKGNKSDFIDSVVLNTFQHWEKASRSFTEGVLASKIDVDGSTGSPIGLFTAMQRVEKVLDEDRPFFVGYDSKFKDTALGHYQWNSHDLVSIILNNSNILLSGSKHVHLAINNISRNLQGTRNSYATNEKLNTAIMDGIYSYMHSGTRLFKDNRINSKFLLEDFPEEIRKKKNITGARGNFLINELELEYRDGYTFMGINNKNKPAEYKNKIYRAWLDLYENAETKEMALNLVKYSFLQSGFKMNLNQFFTLIPHEILKDQGFTIDSNKMFTLAETLLWDKHFERQFVQHNYDNTDVVKRIPSSQIENVDEKYKVIKPKTKWLEQYEETMMGNYVIDYHVPKYITNNLGGGEIGLYERIDIPGDPLSVFYKRIEKLGTRAGKNRVVEYGFNTNVSSVIEDNRLNQATKDLINREEKSLIAKYADTRTFNEPGIDEDAWTEEEKDRMFQEQSDYEKQLLEDEMLSQISFTSPTEESDNTRDGNKEIENGDANEDAQIQMNLFSGNLFKNEDITKKCNE